MKRKASGEPNNVDHGSTRFFCKQKRDEIEGNLVDQKPSASFGDKTKVRARARRTPGLERNIICSLE